MRLEQNLLLCIFSVAKTIHSRLCNEDTSDKTPIILYPESLDSLYGLIVLSKLYEMILSCGASCIGKTLY